MKKPRPSLKMYAIVAGFVLITVLQLIHAIMGLSNINNFSATMQMEKMKKTIDKNNPIIPGEANQLSSGH